MSPRTSDRIRFAVFFWTLLPIGASALCVVLVEIGGRFVGTNSGGILSGFAFAAGLMAALVPIFAAHLTFFAALLGVIGLISGLRPDWKLVMTILLGLAVGGTVLYKIYS